MRAALLLLLVSSVGAQVLPIFKCKPFELVFILDHSENAKKASTLDGGQEFQLLKTAWNNFMNDLQASGDNLFKIWAWDYSSRAIPQELVPRNSLPSQSRSPRIGTLSSGGSWTYMGLDQIKNARPSQPNNLVLIISAQGSMNTGRRNKAAATYNILRNNGWNTYVIGVKSSPTIDMAELTIVNGGKRPVILDDGRATNKKSYTLLPEQLARIKSTILCPAMPITAPPTRPPVTVPTPPSTGICSNCKVKGGFGFDRHPELCDSFYQCLPDGSYVLKHCAQSLVWDNEKATCVRTTMFTCPTGSCTNALAGRLYRSGVCCNMYFSCNGTVLNYMQCPQGQIFDQTQQRCIASNNPIADCQARGGFYCNDRIANTARDCGDYAPDPLGNPCRFLHRGVTKKVALGTMWNQDKCQLVHSDTCANEHVFGNRDLVTPSAQCSAIVISDWENGKPPVYSERDPKLKLYVRVTPEAIRTQGTLVFRPNNKDASAYYFFFNNNEIPQSSAFRVVFKLASSAQIGTEYDLFSNNYCPMCPATVHVTVRKTGANSCVITSKFVDSATRGVVQTSTQVNNAQSMMDLVLVWGKTDVHGRVKVGGNRVQITPVQHSLSSNIRPNKCGILLGGGPNANFVGTIDSFAYYSACTNIDDVMNL